MTEEPTHEPSQPRPRRGSTALIERALASGARTLDDRQLVALVLGRSAARVGARGLLALTLSDAHELIDLGQLEPRAAARLLGAIELVRRLSTQRQRLSRLATPTEIWQFVRPSLAGLRHETVRVLCFDARSNLLRDAVCAHGSVDSCTVDPREVFAPAIACRATAIVLVHNHPSGDAEPSLSDVRLTHQLGRAAEALCIRLVDHLVVTEQGYVSMSLRGMLALEPGQAVPRLQ
jgi:DNA repair protein RadC